MMRKTVAAIIMGLVLVSMASLAQGESLTASGTQTRGTAGKEAELKASPFTLDRDAKISDVHGAGTGFWIERKGEGVLKRFENGDQAIGFKVTAGTYLVYPDLKPQQGEATVSVTFSF